ncbi:pyrroline-5-carboxylate reductase [Anaeroselena agilis]|uniref:Pyrroline-5-carboxylate reductase n=1 Tax=Anaeroselena agilis TaxID=3063788 RepID=A0ABU3NXL5_9FIRM|nr:pyrroline-5-carboxylate reductase [Selenomonadales bacterium 4137-cl]
MLKDKRFLFVGGGAMAEALVRGMLQAGLVEAGQLTVCDVAAERLDYLARTYAVATARDSAAAAAAGPDVLFLTVKPQVIGEVLATLAPAVAKSTLVVSVAAGVKLAALEEMLPELRVVRVMPNTPVAVGAGMSAIALGRHATERDGETAAALFASVGRVVTVKEDAMDAVTGLSGSGPAFAYVMIDALADAGVRVGLPRQTAIALAAQTLYGAAKMVLETGEHPAKLRDMVTSPAGTTIAGVHVLEQKGVRAALIDAVVAAAERSREMGQKHK